MLTGSQIRMHEFKKGVRGYLTEDVDSFVEQIAYDYDRLYSENRVFQEKIQTLETSLEHYKSIESTMNNSILVAQQAADLMKESTRKEISLMVERSKARMMDLFAVYQDVIRRVNVINLDVKAQVASQLELMEKIQKRMEDLTDYFYGEDFKAMIESLNKLGDQFVEDFEKKEAGKE